MEIEKEMQNESLLQISNEIDLEDLGAVPGHIHLKIDGISYRPLLTVEKEKDWTPWRIRMGKYFFTDEDFYTLYKLYDNLMLQAVNQSMLSFYKAVGDRKTGDKQSLIIPGLENSVYSLEITEVKVEAYFRVKGTINNSSNAVEIYCSDRGIKLSKSKDATVFDRPLLWACYTRHSEIIKTILSRKIKEST